MVVLCSEVAVLLYIFTLNTVLHMIFFFFEEQIFKIRFVLVV